MFILKQQPEAGSDGVRVEIFLKPKENVYVPFKYQTFHAISFPNYEKVLYRRIAENLIESF